MNVNINLLNNYLIIINVIGFLSYILNLYLKKYTKKLNIDFLILIISTIGGTLGSLTSIILFDRKITKENIMSKIYILCLLIIEMIVYFILKGNINEQLNFSYINFFKENKYLSIYLLIINLITFIIFGIDKYKAIKNKNRIKIITLLGLSFIGGSIGGLISMYVFNHKTNKNYFTIGIPLIIIMQLIIIFFIMNCK